MDVICSDFCMSSAVASLLALKTAPVMFCVADGSGELGPPCC